jgi:hypothetical protein
LRVYVMATAGARTCLINLIRQKVPHMRPPPKPESPGELARWVAVRGLMQCTEAIKLYKRPVPVRGRRNRNTTLGAYLLAATAPSRVSISFEKSS